MRLSYVVKRLLYALPTLFGAITLVYIIVRLAPGGPIEVLLGDYQAGLGPEALAAIKERYGLDRPALHQYLLFMRNLVQGDFGISIIRRAPVISIILPQIRPTLMLAMASIMVAAVIGIPSGVVAALRRNTFGDYAIMTFAVIWLSAPSFWLGILLIYFLGFVWPLFPMFGGGEPGSLISQLHYLVLPAIAVGARFAALLARVSRSATLDVLGQDYIRTAHAKGLSRRVVVYKHALRNAAIPIVTILGMNLAYMLGGTVVIETVFSRQGLGRTMVDAVFNRDYGVVQGCMVFFCLAIIIVNLATDLVYSVIDKRIRL